MLTSQEKRKYGIGMLLFAIVIVLIALVYIHTVQEKYISALKLDLVQEQAKLSSLGTLLSKNDVNDTVNTILQDCSQENRAQFDTLLGNLSQLHGKDFDTMQQLFNECASYYPMREEMMSLQLQREYQAYTDYMQLLSIVDKNVNTNGFDGDAWGKFVTMEQNRSDLSLKLTDIQGQIITALQQGVLISSQQMQGLLAQAQQVKGSLLVVSTQLEQTQKEILLP